MWQAAATAGAGSLLSLVGGLLKKKPKVPTFTPVSLQEEQQAAISGNRGAFGEASALASQVNQYNQDELMKALEQVVPGIGGINSQASKNIASQLKGELPADVAESVSRASAAKSYSGGTGGSRFAGNLRTRDLGLTSLALTQQGLDNASRWIASARASQVAPQMDVTSMFITPMQQAQNTWKNRQVQFNLQWLNNQLNNAYDPQNIVAGELQESGQALKGVGAGMMGGGFGGGGGLGSQAANPGTLAPLNGPGY